VKLDFALAPGRPFFCGVSLEILELGGKKCLLSIGQDITAQKAAEDALHESQRRFQLIAENLNGIVWKIEPETLRLRYASPAYEKIWERSQKEI